MQVLGVIATMIYAFAVSWGILPVIRVFSPVRATEEIEIDGFNASVHDESACCFE